jgi:hypothetical protein
VPDKGRASRAIKNKDDPALNYRPQLIEVYVSQPLFSRFWVREVALTDGQLFAG